LASRNKGLFDSHTASGNAAQGLAVSIPITKLFVGFNCRRSCGLLYLKVVRQEDRDDSLSGSNRVTKRRADQTPGAQSLRRIFCDRCAALDAGVHNFSTYQSGSPFDDCHHQET
jgi:hypothetical protein